MTVYNFGAGPAMLPAEVMQEAREEFLDFKGIGVSVVEISHRTKDFISLLDETSALFAELAGIPQGYKVLWLHGGAQMQFSAVPLNLIGLKPEHKALYVETGNFSKVAAIEAAKYGNITTLCSGKDCNYKAIPTFDGTEIDPAASYLHITSNNTLFGTAYSEWPDTGDIPLVVDATSDILGRRMDYSKAGVVFAGAQKNIGPSGLAVVVVQEHLIGHHRPETPKLIEYQLQSEQNSLANTINTFAVWIVHKVLSWLKAQGGVEVIEQQNRKKAQLLYQLLDESDYFSSVAEREHRSIMNVCFNLPTETALRTFLTEADQAGLYALKGHRLVGGARASIYNAMPYQGVQALCEFMREFERTKG